MFNIGFVITVINAHDPLRFVAIDHQSGGYIFLSERIADAKIFPTREEAEKRMNTEYVEEKDRRMSNGEIHPGRNRHEAAGLWNERPGPEPFIVAVRQVTLAAPVYDASFTEKIVKGRWK